MYIVSLLLLLVTSVSALEWSPKQLDLSAKKNSSSYTGKFTFKNKSKKSVKIISIKPSCSCTTVELKKLEYGPEESGEIIFRVNFKSKSRLVKSKIEVDTNETQTVEYSLNIKVERDIDISETFEVVPPQKIDIVTLLKNLKGTNNKLTRKIFAKSQSYQSQKTCPYLRTPILKKYFHDALGLRIYTCCEGCLVKVKLNPHEAIAKLAAVGQFPEVFEKRKSQ